MSTFALRLCDSQQNQHFERIAQFIGADESGAFGIRPHHARLVAVLRYGLARFCDDGGNWRYLALPGGVLHFEDNVLTLVAVRYFLGERRDEMVDKLASEMEREDSELHSVRTTLADIERTLIRRLGSLGATMQESIRP